MKVSQITKRMRKSAYIVIRNTSKNILFEGFIKELHKDNPINPKPVYNIDTSIKGNIILTINDK